MIVWRVVLRQAIEESKREFIERESERLREEVGNLEGQEKLFEGIIYTMSGFQDQERVNLKILMDKMGAIYEAELSPACRYLICRFKGTPKLIKARQLQKETGACIFCVTEQFFIDCFVLNKVMPLGNYLVS